ncbi:MAG: SOS response-associated peptidase [Opitutales bacterium]|nr:SOS response-associated peptidase [Opitutales bacterium]
MCGRYTLIKQPISIGLKSPKTIELPDNADTENPAFKPRYNAAPTQGNLVVRKRPEDERVLMSTMRWGLLPSWSRTGKTSSLLINARSETVAEKPSFKAAYQRRRCLVPADGYYEWKRYRSVNQPYYLQLEDESVFFMAGIWETWYDSAGVPTESFAILTTQANTLTAKVHERMPVILEGADTLIWLEGNSDIIQTEKRFELLGPIDSGRMKYRAVNPIVNNNQNDVPDCILEPPVEASTQLDMDF